MATTEFVVLSLQQGIEAFHFLDPVSMRGCSGQALSEPTSDAADRLSPHIEAVAIFLNGARAIAVFLPENDAHPHMNSPSVRAGKHIGYPEDLLPDSDKPMLRPQTFGA